MKKVVMIIASENFRDEEYFITKEILEKGGILVKTACDKEKAIGKFGGEAKVDILINNLDINKFNAIILVGGQGAVTFLNNELTYSIINKAEEKGKLIAAICIAPTILAQAGVLKGKKATVWSNPLDYSAINILKENGAIYEKNEVVIDENIITGENVESAKDFGKAILEWLTKREK